MILADDFHREVGGPENRPWSSSSSGARYVGFLSVVSWVGFELLQRSHQLGISIVLYGGHKKSWDRIQ